jgi:hypothetical protein
MKYTSFPLGHPRVLTREQLDPPTIPLLPWTRVEHNPFKGFLLCRVLPPRGVQQQQNMADNINNDWFLPLLPMRTLSGRLVFPLCAKCGEQQRQRTCPHGEQERSWITAYTHVELNKALSLGYSVLDLFEVKIRFSTKK